MVVSTRVLKEPRGFVRIIQCIMAILAFSTTAGFSTTIAFTHECVNGEVETIRHEFGYPFSLTDNNLTWSLDCKSHADDNGNGFEDDEVNADGSVRSIRLPFDYSSSAMFYVATGVLSFLYTIGILVVYIFLHQQYANDPKIPVIDLALTSILSVFWSTGASAMAQAVGDLKYYLHPTNLFPMIPECGNNRCSSVMEGHYATLNVSLVFGFACFLLWASSLWFVYKETVFHTPPTAPTVTTATTVQSQNAKPDGRV